MVNKQYTVVIVPDDGEETKRFSISRRIFRLGALIIIILLLGNVVFFTLFLPKVLDYDNMKSQNKLMMEERLKVAGLLQDLHRIKQIESYIRHTLGVDVEFPLDPELPDSVKKTNSQSEEGAYFSFLENYPSYIPVTGFITQNFTDKSFSTTDDHYGMDIAAPIGSAISASASGLVVFSGWTYQYGNMVILYHGDEYFSLYGHNQRNLVTQRQFVNRGDEIALLGETGITTGPHLHFEIWKDGKPVDPRMYVNEYRLSDLTITKDE